jgi:hypothetical protein
MACSFRVLRRLEPTSNIQCTFCIRVQLTRNGDGAQLCIPLIDSIPDSYRGCPEVVQKYTFFVGMVYGFLYGFRKLSFPGAEHSARRSRVIQHLTPKFTL